MVELCVEESCEQRAPGACGGGRRERELLPEPASVLRFAGPAPTGCISAL